METYSISEELHTKKMELEAKRLILSSYTSSLKLENEAFIDSKMLKLAKEISEDIEDFWISAKKETNAEHASNIRYNSSTKKIEVISVNKDGFSDKVAELKTLAISIDQFKIGSMLRDVEIECVKENL